MPVQHPEASNPGEQLPSLSLAGRREEAVYGGVYGEGPLTELWP